MRNTLTLLGTTALIMAFASSASARPGPAGQNGPSANQGSSYGNAQHQASSYGNAQHPGSSYGNAQGPGASYGNTYGNAPSPRADRRRPAPRVFLAPAKVRQALQAKRQHERKLSLLEAQLNDVQWTLSRLQRSPYRNVQQARRARRDVTRLRARIRSENWRYQQRLSRIFTPAQRRIFETQMS